jgi:hypothetical protein
MLLEQRRDPLSLGQNRAANAVEMEVIFGISFGCCFVLMPGRRPPNLNGAFTFAVNVLVIIACIRVGLVTVALGFQGKTLGVNRTLKQQCQLRDLLLQLSMPAPRPRPELMQLHDITVTVPMRTRGATRRIYRRQRVIFFASCAWGRGHKARRGSDYSTGAGGAAPAVQHRPLDGRHEAPALRRWVGDFNDDRVVRRGTHMGPWFSWGRRYVC